MRYKNMSKNTYIFKVKVSLRLTSIWRTLSYILCLYFYYYIYIFLSKFAYFRALIRRKKSLGYSQLPRSFSANEISQ